MKWPKCGKVWTKLGTEELKEAAMTALEITLETEFDEVSHMEPWRNRVAHDLNWILGRAEFHLETSNDESDQKFAKAALAIVTRVAQFEEIQVKQ